MTEFTPGEQAAIAWARSQTPSHRRLVVWCAVVVIICLCATQFLHVLDSYDSSKWKIGYDIREILIFIASVCGGIAFLGLVTLFHCAMAVIQKTTIGVNSYNKSTKKD